MNVQTNDIPLLIYLCKFAENGGEKCGYLLKPDFMLHNVVAQIVPSSFTKPQMLLEMKIISGQKLQPEDENDVRDIVDPYIEISLRGTKLDEENCKTVKSLVIKNNGFNPVFNLYCKYKICCPEMAMLVFQVFDKDLVNDTKLGWYAIALNCIRPGYRLIPLLNSKLELIPFSYLFAYIKISKY